MVRLLVSGKFAGLELQRLANPRTRKNRRRLGWGVLIASPLILLYGLHGRLSAWLWLAAVVGVLSGAEQLASAYCQTLARMLWHARLFGALSVAAAIIIYVFFLR
jgi:hypothetical protein